MASIKNPKSGCTRDAGRERILLLLEVDSSERCLSQIIAEYPKIAPPKIPKLVSKTIIRALKITKAQPIINSDRKDISIALRRYNFPPRDSAKGTEIKAER